MSEGRYGNPAGMDNVTVRSPLGPGGERTVTLSMPAGLPYRPSDTPTSYVYVVRFCTSDGFAPFLETPPSQDARFLGAMVTITPEFR